MMMSMQMWTLGYSAADAVALATTTTDQSSTNWVSRILWIVCLSCLGAYAGWQIFLCEQSYEYPSWDQTTDHESTLMYPSVIICPFLLHNYHITTKNTTCTFSTILGNYTLDSFCTVDQIQMREPGSNKEALMHCVRANGSPDTPAWGVYGKYTYLSVEINLQEKRDSKPKESGAVPNIAPRISDADAYQQLYASTASAATSRAKPPSSANTNNEQYARLPVPKPKPSHRPPNPGIAAAISLRSQTEANEYSYVSHNFIAMAGNSYWGVILKSQDVYLDGRTMEDYEVLVSSTPLTQNPTTIILSFAFGSFDVTQSYQYTYFDWLSLLGVLGGASSLAMAGHIIGMLLWDRIFLHIHRRLRKYYPHWCCECCRGLGDEIDVEEEAEAASKGAGPKNEYRAINGDENREHTGNGEPGGYESLVEDDDRHPIIGSPIKRPSNRLIL